MRAACRRFVLRLADGTKELVSPPFDSILSGCSVQRAFALAQSAIAGGEGPETQQRMQESGLSQVVFRHITAEEARAGALELIKFGVSSRFTHTSQPLRCVEGAAIDDFEAC